MGQLIYSFRYAVLPIFLTVNCNFIQLGYNDTKYLVPFMMLQMSLTADIKVVQIIHAFNP